MALSINSYDLQERLKAVLKPHLNRSAATPRLAVVIALLTAIVLVPIATMHAQVPNSQAALAGSVYDASGGAVPHAIITVTGLDTHNKEVTRSGEDGTYSLRALPAGRYTIEVKAPGFSIYQRPVMIAPGQTVPVDASLALGGVVENVDVVAHGPANSAASTPHGIPQRIRVGGNVQAVKLVYKTDPLYPENAKRNGIQGSVVLQGVISTSGNLIGLQVQSQAVDPELIQAARDAVSQWRWEPTLLNGEPVEVITSITVNFRLD